jgi:hypothetical protein
MVRSMRWIGSVLVSLLLAGCVVAPPAGPSVMALPGTNKSFAQFQQDETACRQYALQQAGFASPQESANASAAASAAVGTIIGGAAGAAIGAATGNAAAGAAIGAASGLFLGGASALTAAPYSAALVQRRYDIGYTQCMYASGNTVQGVATASIGAAPSASVYPGYPAYAYAPAYYYPPYPAYYPYPAFYGASLGFAFSSGHHHHH